MISKDEKLIVLDEKGLDDLSVDPESVALHLRQKLLPVEGEGGVIFPPTYAGENGDPIYNLDKLADGTLRCTIDSVGSQANRLEPIFKADPLRSENLAGTNDLSPSDFVPQIDIVYGDGRKTSIFDAGHRLGDAIIRVSKNESFDLPNAAKKAFDDFLDGDATGIAKLAPTSLVFGVWDSRESQAKLPRILESTIHATDVSPLTRSAVYNATIDYAKLGVFDPKEKARAEKDAKRPESKRGFVNALATAAPGGLVVHGAIWHDIKINLIALRRLHGQRATALRQYILGLTLAAAVEPLDGFLRSGCLLTRDPNCKGVWRRVNRDGTRPAVELNRVAILQYAAQRMKNFGKGEDHEVTFQLALAREDVNKDEEANSGQGAKKGARARKERAKSAGDEDGTGETSES